MNISDEKYQQLLEYIQGELTWQEAGEIELWINDSDDNKEIYNSILKDYMYVRFSHRSDLISKERSREKINSQLRKSGSRLFYYSVAASIVILLGISSLFIFENISFDKEKVVVAENNIVPGEKKAVLYLSSGEKVDISDNNSLLKEVEGTEISIDSLKGITYKNRNTIESKKLVYNKVVVPRGGEYMATLADGTKVWLNAESELRYPVSFSAKNRVVFLKGEAYFDVTKDKNKPFIVSVNNFRLKVFGTEFNVNAYNINKIKTVLVEGAVGIRKKGTKKNSMLKPGQLGSMDMKSGIIEVKDVDVYKYVAWKNGDFVFVNERLESIMEKLSRWYDIKVFFQNEEVRDVMLSGDMKRYEDPKDFLYFVERSSDVRFKIKGKTVIISKKK